MNTAGSVSKPGKRWHIALAALSTMLFWGSAFPAVKICLEGFALTADNISEKLLIAGIRFLSAGLILILICLIKGTSIKVDRKYIPQVILIGFFTTTMQYACNYMALSHMSAGRAAVWGQASTFLVVICAGLIDSNDKLTGKKILGSLLGIGGILASNINQVGGGFSFQGDAVLLIGALGSATGTLLSKKALKTMRALPLAAWQMTIGGTTLLLIGFTTHGHLRNWTLQGELSLLYLILVSSVAYGIWMSLTRRYALSGIAIYRFGIPVSGVIISCLLSNEPLFSLQNLLSLSLVAAGIIIVNHSPNLPSRTE